MPLEQRPVIRQVGLNVHGQRRVERYVMDRSWSLHAYRWQGSLKLRGTVFPVRPGHVSVEPPDTPLVWRYDAEPEFDPIALAEAIRADPAAPPPDALQATLIAAEALTASGRRQLAAERKEFERVIAAIQLVLQNA
jgi:hypothetical protein